MFRYFIRCLESYKIWWFHLRILLFFLNKFIVYGCAGSSSPCGLFCSCGQRGLLSMQRCSVGSGRTGFSSCSTRAQQWLLPSSRAHVVVHGLGGSMACGIFPDQGLNPCFLPWQADCSPLSHQGSLRILFLSGGDRHVLWNDHTVCRFRTGGDGCKALWEQGKQGWEVVDTNCRGWVKLHREAAVELTKFGSPTPRFCNRPGGRYS